MLCESIRALILEERERQGPGFIQGVDIDVYLAKLEEKAEILSDSISGRCRGLVAFYCNDQATKQAYITLVLVDPGTRRAGLGKWLVASVLETAKRRGFTSCRLEVNQQNHGAYAMYLSLGFRVAERREQTLLLEVAL
jgi:ribosomal-protein-alanine N-acetyltransferase